ncbi:MAG: hypothetical protein RLZZ584_3857, partial [Pseudomonadota bacterium]
QLQSAVCNCCLWCANSGLRRLEPDSTPYGAAAAFEQLNHEQPALALNTLSMGMSADLEAAVLEGSTLVRVGTAIVGSRS